MFQQRLPDFMAGTSLTAGVTSYLAPISELLQFGVLVVGLATGVLSLYLNIQRIRNERKNADKK